MRNQEQSSAQGERAEDRGHDESPKSFSFLHKEDKPDAKPERRTLVDMGEPVPFSLEKMSARLVKAVNADPGVLRMVESGIHNKLYRAVRGGERITLRSFSEAVRSAASKLPSVHMDAFDIKALVISTERGYQGLEKAISVLEKDAAEASKKEVESFIGLNDYIDARHKIDAVQILYDPDTPEEIAEVRLVQAKSSSRRRGENASDIRNAHQEFVDQLIGRLEARDTQLERAMKQRKAEFLRSLEKEGAEGTQATMDRYGSLMESLFLSSPDQPSEEELKRLIPESLSFAEVVDLLRSPKIMRQVAGVFGNLEGLEGKQLDAFMAYCSELSDTLDQRGLSKEEADDLYPETQLLSDHVNIKKISSVIIEDGQTTMDKPLTLRGKDHVLIKS